MANVNIRTPRFYVDWINYAMSRGTPQNNNYDVMTGGNLLSPSSGGTEAELFDMRPLNQVQFNTTNVATKKVLVNIDSESSSQIPFNFIAILNHNLKSADGSFIIGASNTESHINDEDFAIGHTAVQSTFKVNANVAGSGTYAVTPVRDGTTIVAFSDSQLQYWGIQFQGNTGTSSDEFSDTVGDELKIGGIMLGQYYDMPVSPDLDVKRNITFDTVNVQQSLGGQRFSTMINHGRKGSSQNMSPFQIDTNRWGSQGGRMSYDMKFSYLNSTDVMPDAYSSLDRDDDAVINDVWNMTSGNHTPFIFTTDGTSTAESDYLFARFAQNNFDMTQVAPDVYSVSLKIEEEF